MIVGDEPQAGFYATRLAPGGPFVGVKIWRDCHGWVAEINGLVSTDLAKVWPYCARFPIREAEYDRMKERAAWARRISPDHPAANPYRRVDLRRLPPIKPQQRKDRE